MKRLLHALAVLWSLVSRTRPIPCESVDLPIRRFAKGQPSELAHPHISESTLNNKTIFHLDRRYYNVLAYMTLFMCLIAVQQVSAQSEPAAAAANTTVTIIEKDLDRFPMVKHDPDLSQVNGLVIGDSIPDNLWDLPLWVVNHAEGRDTVTLREYKGKKLLVLDFWARWCAPCVESMDKWNEYVNEWPSELAVLGVHMDFDYKALPFTQNRGWRLPSVIGENAIVLNRHFYTRSWVGGVVFIMDGKLLSIPGAKGYGRAEVSGLLNGSIESLASNSQATYFYKP